MSQEPRPQNASPDGGADWYDNDLSPVLEKASNEDLEPLVQHILKASTEELSASPQYRRHKHNHVMYVALIESEIRKFGGNTIANKLWRGDCGPAYREVVCDVASKVGAEFAKDAPVGDVEGEIFAKLVGKAWEKLTDEQKLEFYRETGIDPGKVGSAPHALPVMAVQAAIKAALKLGGLAAYQISVIVANAVARHLLGHGLKFAANAALTSGLRNVAGFIAGPIGWALTALWTAYDIAGPAYRVTLPCVVRVAMLRLQQNLALPASNSLVTRPEEASR